jgi:hypothetical protein
MRQVWRHLLINQQQEQARKKKFVHCNQQGTTKHSGGCVNGTQQQNYFSMSLAHVYSTSTNNCSNSATTCQQTTQINHNVLPSPTNIAIQTPLPNGSHTTIWKTKGIVELLTTVDSQRRKFSKSGLHSKTSLSGRREAPMIGCQCGNKDLSAKVMLPQNMLDKGQTTYLQCLDSFYRFMKDHKEDNLLKEGSYDVLAAYPRVYAFLKFLQMWGYRSSTVRNKAAILKGCLNHI